MLTFSCSGRKRTPDSSIVMLTPKITNGFPWASLRWLMAVGPRRHLIALQPQRETKYREGT